MTVIVSIVTYVLRRNVFSKQYNNVTNHKNNEIYYLLAGKVKINAIPSNNPSNNI